MVCRRLALVILRFTCLCISVFGAPRPRPETVSGQVVAYSTQLGCLNGNGYWSMIIRVEKPKEASFPTDSW
jgi:hypothetical protein